MKKRFWIVSYDNVDAIKKLYSGFRSIVYSVGYTARDRREGKEVMFFSPKLVIPELVGPVKQVGTVIEAATASGIGVDTTFSTTARPEDTEEGNGILIMPRNGQRGRER